MRTWPRLLSVWIVLAAACSSKTPTQVDDTKTDAADQVLYRSDYFVFLSADPADALIVPIDVNWEPREGGRLFVELKAWRGTAKAWPMVYHVGEQAVGAMPTAWHDVPPAAGFVFSEDRIEAKGSDIGALRIDVPDASEGTSHERRDDNGLVVYTVWQTFISDGPRRVEGWLIQEHIEFGRLMKTSEGQFFLRYHWIPVVTPEAFYLFNDSRVRGQHAVRWQRTEDGLKAEALDRFGFREADHRRDAPSGRTQVPMAWTISAPAWTFEASLQDKAGHSGHGDNKKSGRALYRQATALGKDGQGRPVHAMVELILED